MQKHSISTESSDNPIRYMSHSDLISLLKSNIGRSLTVDLAADICVLASQLPTLVRREQIERINPEQYGEFTFAVEKIEDIREEVKPLHQAHWDETEIHRHGLELNPDYEAFARYERAGRYVLFTLRREGKLVGNCAMYVDRSMHTQTLIATEDTLYLLPEARRGRVASRFVTYVEKVLKQLGAKEICVTVKTVNKAGRFFGMLGYKHVENGLMKILEN
jgi:GNAT superfamily N-acetyltransferase